MAELRETANAIPSIQATVRKYDDGGESGPECEYFPKLKLTTGQKVVCDENLTARGFVSIYY